MSKKEVWVVVCTEHRGVFFGRHDPQFGALSAKEVRLFDAQMCVYWSVDVRGVMGLAGKGPTSGCRISEPAPAITLHGVTAVIEASDTAIEAWKAAPWD